MTVQRFRSKNREWIMHFTIKIWQLVFKSINSNNKVHLYKWLMIYIYSYKYSVLHLKYFSWRLKKFFMSPCIRKIVHVTLWKESIRDIYEIVTREKSLIHLFQSEIKIWLMLFSQRVPQIFVHRSILERFLVILRISNWYAVFLSL